MSAKHTSPGELCLIGGRRLDTTHLVACQARVLPASNNRGCVKDSAAYIIIQFYTYWLLCPSLAGVSESHDVAITRVRRPSTSSIPLKSLGQSSGGCEYLGFAPSTDTRAACGAHCGIPYGEPPRGEPLGSPTGRRLDITVRVCVFAVFQFHSWVAGGGRAASKRLHARSCGPGVATACASTIPRLVLPSERGPSAADGADGRRRPRPLKKPAEGAPVAFAYSKMLSSYILDARKLGS